MKSVTIKYLFICFCFMFLLPYIGKAQLEDSVTRSKYDKRVHNYKQYWSSLIPTHTIIQYAGNMGAISSGIGWDFTKKRQVEFQLLFGFLPKFSSKNHEITMTLKLNYIPFAIYLGKDWSFEPLEASIYLNTIFGPDFWATQPDKYPSGYYWFTTKLRPNIALGQRIEKEIPNNKRKAIKSLTFFYELSTNDVYINNYMKNDYIKLKDIISLSLGLKIQIL